MCFFGITPFFNIGFPMFGMSCGMPWGTNFSRINYDTSSSNPFSSMNLEWNAHFMDSQARAGLYMVPNYNSNNSTPYGNTFDSNSFLLDPNYAIKQTQWNLQNQQGNWGFNFGNVQFNWPNFSNFFSNNSGNSSGNSSGSGSGNSTVELTTAEKENCRKFTTLLEALVKTEGGKKYSAMVTDAKNAANKAKTYDEKISALQEAYDRIDEDTKEEFFDEKYKEKLEDMGFQGKYDDTESGLLKYIKEYRRKEKADRKEAPFNKVSPTNSITEDNILAFVSAWNTEEKDHNLITELVKLQLRDKEDRVGNSDDAEGKTISEFVTCLTDALLSRADDARGKNKDKIKKAANALREEIKAYEKVVEENPKRRNADYENINKAASKLNEKFNELYRLLRIYELDKFKDTFEADYGFIAGENYDDSIASDTSNDLKGEKFSGSSSSGTRTGAGEEGDGTEEIEEAEGTERTEGTEEEEEVGIVEEETPPLDASGSDTHDESVTKANIGKYVGEGKPYKQATTAQLNEINSSLSEDQKVDKAYIDAEGNAWGFDKDDNFISLGYKF